MRIKLKEHDLRRLQERGDRLPGRPKGPALPAPPERDIQRAVIAFLESKDCLVIRVNGGMLRRADGGRMRCNRTSIGTCSDLLVLTPFGVWIAIELKRPGKKPTAGQREFLDGVEARGGIACVVQSVEDAAQAFDLAKTRSTTATH